MTLSGIHNFKELQPGFPIKIASGMTICESIFFKEEIACTMLKHVRAGYFFSS